MMSCASLALNTPKQKRSRFSQKHQKDGSRLAELLKEQAKQFPRFAPHIVQLIETVVADSQRTRSTDRERVLASLRQWPGGLGIRDIMEDTRLTHWEVRQILYEMIEHGIVKERREPVPGLSSCQHRKIYELSHKRA
jgi:hypothetical protein